MPPELGEVRQWLTKARNDWTAARKLFASPEPDIEVVAFLSQQAVEKTLKAYLLSREIEFQKTHDLSLLLDQCVDDDPSFETLRDRVEPLSQYAVAFRKAEERPRSRDSAATASPLFTDPDRRVRRRCNAQLSRFKSQK